MKSRRPIVIAAAMLSVGTAWMAATEPVTVAAIFTSSQSRTAYLAHALIWRDPGALSPAELLEGPAGAFPYTFEQATIDGGIECTFVQAGKELGGHTLKFICRNAEGRQMRLKYWDPQTKSGNREVFANIAASRLMWALGFEAVPALPITVRCNQCPADPMTGSGSPGTHRYVAMWQAFWPTPAIVSEGKLDQGWSWQELDDAIRSLPPGPERVRQRTYFEALTLLGVFMQHGDRKSEQQRLYCTAPADTTAGRLPAAVADKPLILFENPGATACSAAAVTIVDVGATFGGAGRTSSDTGAKMNLEEWQRKPVFKDSSHNQCRGELTISLKAGHGESNPVISEEGRRFLVDQLHRLTPDHIRAIFRAARVDQLESSHKAHGGIDDAIEAWVAAFQEKVRQIEAERCQPAS